MAKSNIMKTRVPCAVCGSPDNRVVSTTVEHEFSSTTDDRFTVCRCAKCGFIYLNPRPALEELSTIYPPDYSAYVDNSSQKESGGLLFRLKDYVKSKIQFPGQVKELISRYRGDRPISVLDVGCGTGDVLDAFRRLGGARVKTYGVDFSASAGEIASRKGHTVYVGMFEDIELPGDHFDIIWCSHVLEHVADPGAVLRKIAKLLARDGRFHCQAPNVASIEAALLIRLGLWGGLHTPRHWSFFSPATIVRLGKNSGLAADKIEYCVIPIFWFWTFHALLHRMLGSVRIADAVIPRFPSERNRLWWFFLLSVFTMMDFLILGVTRKTAAMMITFRKVNSAAMPEEVRTS